MRLFSIGCFRITLPTKISKLCGNLFILTNTKTTCIAPHKVSAVSKTLSLMRGGSIHPPTKKMSLVPSSLWALQKGTISYTKMRTCRALAMSAACKYAFSFMWIRVRLYPSVMTPRGNCMVQQWREPCWRMRGRQSMGTISWWGKAFCIWRMASASRSGWA